MEVLHTLLLGTCKHILKIIMPEFCPKIRKEILARIKAFNTSGFSTKMYGNVCQYYNSFVGRDFKGWSQMCAFILWLYLSDGYKEVLLAHLKVCIIIIYYGGYLILSAQVFKIAYCNFFEPCLAEEWNKVCIEFVQAVKRNMPALLLKQKTHLILHLVSSMMKFGPSSSFSAERYPLFALYLCISNKLNSLGLSLLIHMFGITMFMETGLHLVET